MAGYGINNLSYRREGGEYQGRQASEFTQKPPWVAYPGKDQNPS